MTEPAARRLEETGFYARHANDRVAYEQLRDVDPWAWAPSLFRIQRDVVEPRLEGAVFAARDPREVMREAREAAREP